MRITHKITLQEIARDIGYSFDYTSRVLRGVHDSEVLCDKVEERLNEIEEEHLQLAA